MELAKRHLIYLLNRIKIVNSSGCWLSGNNYNEYGKIRLEGKFHHLHRVSAYIYLDLDIDNNELQANHKIECKFKGCFNPEHIYVGNQSENNKDRVLAGKHHNANKTHCSRGHKFDQLKYDKGGKVAQRRCSQCRRIYG